MTIKVFSSECMIFNHRRIQIIFKTLILCHEIVVEYGGGSVRSSTGADGTYGT